MRNAHVMCSVLIPYILFSDITVFVFSLQIYAFSTKQERKSGKSFFLMRSKSLANDNVADNFEQIFGMPSLHNVVKQC